MKVLLIILTVASVAYTFTNMPTPNDFRELWDITFNKKGDK